MRTAVSWLTFSVLTGLLVLTLLAAVARAELVPPGEPGADLEALERRVRELETELLRLQASDERRGFLEQEYHLYRQFIERQWEQWQRFVEWLFGVAAGFVALVAAAAAFLGVRTVREAEREIREAAEGELRRVSDEASEQVKTMAAEVQGDIDGLRRVLQRERSYRRSRVLAIATQDCLTEMGARELRLLEERGISVKAEPYPVPSLAERVDRCEVDIVVYRYAGEENRQDPKLGDLIGALTTARRRVPFCVYAPLVRVDKGDEALLKNYEWYTFANTPVTLVSSVYALTHVFCEEGGAYDGP